MAAAATASVGSKGVVRQVIGPVLDVEFPAGKLPKILNALRIEGTTPAGQDVALTAEVQQLLGDHRVRAVAMSGTDGLVRGMEALDTGSPISVPVGEATPCKAHFTVSNKPPLPRAITGAPAAIASTGAIPKSSMPA